MTERSTPTRLVLVRHAESVGNLARDLAESNGDQLIDIATRDMDGALSPTGEEQAARLGTLARRPRTQTVHRRALLAYVRAAEIARITCAHAGNVVEWCSTSFFGNASSASSTASRALHRSAVPGHRRRTGRGAPNRWVRSSGACTCTRGAALAAQRGGLGLLARDLLEQVPLTLNELARG
ncbi:MAG TPA: hypothetical protein VGN51_13480 [Acidimicrobiia bacterium]